MELEVYLQTFLPRGDFRKKNWTKTRHKQHGQKIELMCNEIKDCTVSQYPRLGLGTSRLINPSV
jgi:hypothetical protein